MADTEDERTLSEIVVMELVEQGLDSSMREPILDAVEKSEGSSTGGSRRLPLAGALFGLGTAIGFLAGRESGELEDVSVEDIEEPEIIEDLTGEAEADEADDDTEAADDDVNADDVDDADEADETEEGGSSGILGRLVLALGAIAVVVFLRQKLAGGDDEEWEPIEEFEPATDLDTEEADDEEETDEEADVDDVETVEDLEEKNE